MRLVGAPTIDRLNHRLVDATSLTKHTDCAPIPSSVRTREKRETPPALPTHTPHGTAVFTAVHWTQPCVSSLCVQPYVYQAPAKSVRSPAFPDTLQTRCGPRLQFGTPAAAATRELLPHICVPDHAQGRADQEDRGAAGTAGLAGQGLWRHQLDELKAPVRPLPFLAVPLLACQRLMPFLALLQERDPSSAELYSSCSVDWLCCTV